jgi:hypothetical protein
LRGQQRGRGVAGARGVASMEESKRHPPSAANQCLTSLGIPPPVVPLLALVAVLDLVLVLAVVVLEHSRTHSRTKSSSWTRYTTCSLTPPAHASRPRRGGLGEWAGGRVGGWVSRRTTQTYTPTRPAAYPPTTH